MTNILLSGVVLSFLLHLANARVASPIFRGNNDFDRRIDDRSSNNVVAETKSLGNGRLSEVEWSSYNLKEPNGPGSYAFGYDNAVDPMGNEQFRSEERLQNGTVIGEYGYTDYKNARIVRVTYTADIRGYRAKTQILPLDV